MSHVRLSTHTPRSNHILLYLKEKNSGEFRNEDMSWGRMEYLKTTKWHLNGSSPDNLWENYNETQIPGTSLFYFTCIVHVSEPILAVSIG